MTYDMWCLFLRLAPVLQGPPRGGVWGSLAVAPVFLSLAERKWPPRREAWCGSVKFPFIIILIIIFKPSVSPCLFHRHPGVQGHLRGNHAGGSAGAALGFVWGLLKNPGDTASGETGRDAAPGASVASPSCPAPLSGIAGSRGPPGVSAAPARWEEAGRLGRALCGDILPPLPGTGIYHLPHPQAPDRCTPSPLSE